METSVSNSPELVCWEFPSNPMSRVNREVVATVALDRSDAKITVRRYESRACTVHGERKQV